MVDGRMFCNVEIVISDYRHESLTISIWYCLLFIYLVISRAVLVFLSLGGLQALCVFYVNNVFRNVYGFALDVNVMVLVVLPGMLFYCNRDVCILYLDVNMNDRYELYTTLY